MNIDWYGIGEHVPLVKTCEYWFRLFKSSNFDISDKKREGRPVKFENAELWAKTPQIYQKTWKSNLSARRRLATCCKSRQGNCGDASMGYPTLSAIFTRHCFFRLSLVLVDASWRGWAELHFLRRSQKLGIKGKFFDHLKRRNIFSTESVCYRKDG